MPDPAPLPMAFGPRGPLRGTVRVPGDKSISHRALMLAAMACGRSTIEGLSEGTDAAATAAALEAMGVRIERSGPDWLVDGVGTGGLLQPEGALDMGNSGTSTRLLMGLLASHPLTAAFTGDASLCRRPMDRIIDPLRRMGVDIDASPGKRLPLRLRGLCPAAPLTHRLDVASAQVKSALLLAGLNTPGVTRIIEPVRTRDHTERMLARFGAQIDQRQVDGECHIELRGEANLQPQHVRISGDPSAAAFLTVAALIVPGSEIRIKGVGTNPIRTGLFELLKTMGAEIRIENARDLDGEPVGDLVASHSALRGIDVPPEIIPSMIDEFPIFFVAAAFAEGTSRASGLEELRVKESDRIAAMAAGLRAIGADAEETGDGLVIAGSGGRELPGAATIRSALDHRLAMSFAVAGLHCARDVGIDDISAVETSFPDFPRILDALASGG